MSTVNGGAYSSRFFDLFMLPLESASLRQRRSEYVPLAAGDVLEIGAGTGANLPFFRFDRIRSLTVTDLEPDYAAVRRKIRAAGDGRIPVPVTVREADVRELPFPAGSFDTVVFTLTFCSVPDPAKGLREVHRVLRPGGRAVFIEHVLSDRPCLAEPMRRVTPLWRRISAGCHLDRDTAAAIEAAGLRVERLERFGGGAVIAGTAVRPD